MQIFL